MQDFTDIIFTSFIEIIEASSDTHGNHTQILEPRKGDKSGVGSMIAVPLADGDYYIVTCEFTTDAVDRQYGKINDKAGFRFISSASVLDNGIHLDFVQSTDMITREVVRKHHETARKAKTTKFSFEIPMCLSVIDPTSSRDLVGAIVNCTCDDWHVWAASVTIIVDKNSADYWFDRLKKYKIQIKNR